MWQVVDQLLGQRPAAAPAARKLTLRCPEGAVPGGMVKIRYEGQTLAVAVPPGVGTGDTFEAELPGSEPPRPAAAISEAEFRARASSALSEPEGGGGGLRKREEYAGSTVLAAEGCDG